MAKHGHMKNLVALVLVGLIAATAISCGADSAEESVSTCLAGSTDCSDDATDNAAPLVESIAIDDSPDSIVIFGGFYYRQGDDHMLCASLAESYPPQCGELVVQLAGNADTILESVKEAFGNPDEAMINEVDDVAWTERWINLSGPVSDSRLIIGG